MFGGFRAFIFGFIGAAIGLVLWRVWCEVMLILFRIHGDLAQIVRNTAPAGAMPPRPMTGAGALTPPPRRRGRFARRRGCGG